MFSCVCAVSHPGAFLSRTVSWLCSRTRKSSQTTAVSTADVSAPFLTSEATGRRLYNPEEEFVELTDLLLSHLLEVGASMTRMLEFHISLSQTVVLRYHWITPFVQSLKDLLSPYDRFYCVSDKVKIYCNQEKTRTFLGLEVSAGDKYLLELVHEVDKCMEEYDLKTFYKSPSFHISLGWCLGDATAQLAKHQQELQDIVDKFEDSARILRVYADQVRCKTGNKIFSFPLQ
ncbi:U6 snRNA phosphodiesterase isoform X1 [Callorhinchus milii]|uniref:U6 snRNA phosphodiesterase isoform X1 n=1 Tax=Callorhinchus milii TaxID=7868 RepID=UPI001C3F62D4|nr:U6 snRNA phosphodiesterase isoform X1 [Callorhinchus milii]